MRICGGRQAFRQNLMVRTGSDEERCGTDHNIGARRMLHMDAAPSKLEDRLGNRNLEGSGKVG